MPTGASAVAADGRGGTTGQAGAGAGPADDTRDPRTADAGDCRTSPLTELASTAPRQRLILLALATDGAQLQAPQGPASPAYALLAEGEGQQTEVLLLDASLSVQTRRVLAARVDAAVGLGGRVLALSRSTAADGATFRVTWFGADEADDAALALSVPAPTGGAVRRSVAGSRALFVWTDGRHPPLALPIRHDPAATGDARLRFDGVRALSPDVELADARAVQLLGVTLGDDGFATIVREGAAEAADSQMWLATERGHVPVPALEDTADIEAMVVVGEEVWVVATFEFSRPLLLRIAPTGELASEPTALPPGAALPEPFSDGDPARLLEEGTRLLLRRRNALGDPLPPDTVLADRPAAGLPADVVREAERYLVVYQDRDEAAQAWPLRFVSVDCAGR